MSDESSVEAAPQPQGRRLTLRRAKVTLVRQVCSALLLSGSGLYLISDGIKTAATFCCLGAVVSAGSVPIFWKRYRLVRSGAIVTVRPQVASRLVHVHPAAAIVVTSLITLVVLAMGGVTLYILPHLSRMVSIQAFLVGFNLLLWLLTGFLWYRIVTERRKNPLIEPVYEQGEDVWPPAPQIPKNE